MGHFFTLAALRIARFKTKVPDGGGGSLDVFGRLAEDAGPFAAAVLLRESLVSDLKVIHNAVLL